MAKRPHPFVVVTEYRFGLPWQHLARRLPSRSFEYGPMDTPQAIKNAQAKAKARSARYRRMWRQNGTLYQALHKRYRNQARKVLHHEST